jgi:RNA polymerase sigma-70 factor (ECF subfamily)
VFLQIWQRAETYNSMFGSPKAWLVRIAHNRAIDRLRSKGFRNRKLETDIEVHEELHTEDRSANPFDTAAQSDERAAVKAALAKLPKEQRQLIELAYFQGFTQSELAAKFQIPLGTVKTRIRAGMTALRQYLLPFIDEFKIQQG